ncbi:hypothetical protein [Nonomuraea longicatena]|uniref:Uncharacterized protein n=1 Tax=Nonomuraea longicatena TaxID=83682 RepID=A0ABP4AC92_9ACTN
MRVLPYRVVLGEISLTVEAARLDGLAVPYELVSGRRHVVALHHVERADWWSAVLSVVVEGPESELSSGPWSNMACLATLTERRTRAHVATRLRMDRPGLWSGEVELSRDRFDLRAELSACLVAKVDGILGRRIATADSPWTVDLRPRSPTHQGERLITRWADFGSPDNPLLHPYKSDPWSVETNAETPVLYLNSGFEGLRALLESTRPAERAVRDSVAAQIASDAWSGLFQAAAGQVENAHWPGGWQESVLRRMLFDVFPDRSPDDGLRELIRRREDSGDLHARVRHAAAKQARLPGALGTFIRTLRRTGQEST